MPACSRPWDWLVPLALRTRVWAMLTWSAANLGAGWESGCAWVKASAKLEDGQHLVVGVSEPGDHHRSQIGDPAIVGRVGIAVAHQLHLDAALAQVGHRRGEVIGAKRRQRPLRVPRVAGALEQKEAGALTGMEHPPAGRGLVAQAQCRLVEGSRA